MRSKNHFNFFFLTASLLLSTSCNQQVFAQSIDYTKLNHKIFVDALRGGNHDPSGANEYYFTVVVSALKNTKADLELPAEKHQKIALEAVKFGEVKVNVLTLWRPEADKAEETLIYNISGDNVRQLVAQGMNEFKVREEEVAVMAEITLYEKNKKFGFLGEDTLVGATKYFPIPINKLQASMRTNLKLSISDDKGTQVIVKVKYEEPIEIQNTASAPTANGEAAPATSVK